MEVKEETMKEQWEEQEFIKRMRERATRELPVEIAKEWYGEERRTIGERREGDGAGFLAFSAGALWGVFLVFAIRMVVYFW